MRGSVSVCLYKGRQIEKTCINFFKESGLSATLKRSLVCLHLIELQVPYFIWLNICQFFHCYIPLLNIFPIPNLVLYRFGAHDSIHNAYFFKLQYINFD